MREKCLPRNALWIRDPRLLRSRIAARRGALLENGSLCLLEPPIDLGKLACALDLDAQMIEADVLSASGDREVYPRVL
jgi:hypothetical protein